MKKSILIALMLTISVSAFALEWVEVEKIMASDGEAYDRFGWSVSISGEYAVVGSRFHDYNELGTDSLSYSGAAYIYHYESGTWVQQKKLVAFDRHSGDQFGVSVSISGAYAIIGASYQDYDAVGANYHNCAGAAYIYHFDGTSWTLQQKILQSDRGACDYFGSSVSISGEYAIVGSYNQGYDVTGNNHVQSAGAAYIFHYNGSIWVQQQKLVASDRHEYDRFGESVAISENDAVVGVKYQDYDLSGNNYIKDAGAVYIYHYNGSTWEQQKIIVSSRNEEDYFGHSVSIYSKYLIVGAYGQDYDLTEDRVQNAGAAYIYRYDGDSWTLQQKILQSDRYSGDNFGRSVSIYDNIAAIGAWEQNYDASGENYIRYAGAAYIFYRNESNWTQYQKIVSSDRDVEDYFGNSISIFEGNAIVASFRKNSDAGVAYIFESIGSLMPEADFLTDQTTGIAPLNIIFTDITSESPISWNWDFGDGENSTSQNPQHTYSSPGIYTVSLTATNLYGNDTEVKNNHITVYAPLQAEFEASPIIGTYPLTVQFTDHSTETPTSWSWNFGDGSSSTSQNPQHIYSSPGTYSVMLIASNQYGSDTEEKSNLITVYAPLQAEFEASPTIGTYPLTVQFTDLSTGTPTSWNWDFGDGNSSNNQNPQHTYSSPGTYTVSLTASNQYGSDTEIKNDYITGESSTEVFCTGIKFYDNVGINSDNPDNLVIQGLPVRFKLKAMNALTQNILTGYSVIRSSSPYVTIIDSMATFNNITSNTEAWSIDEYEMIIDKDCPDGTELGFSIILRSQITPTGPWGSAFSFPVKPLIIDNMYIDDDSNPDSRGNSNGIIEPGETIELIPTISNLSDSSFYNVSGELISPHNSIAVWNYHSGGSGTVYSSYRYNVISNYAEPISPGSANITPEADYVFDYNAGSTYKFDLVLILSACFADNSVMRFSDTITFNEGYSDLSVGIEQTDAVRDYELQNAYPNPFNPTTCIRYGLPETSDIDLVILDIFGHTVKKWSFANQQTGWYNVNWDGTDMSGNSVSTGIYIYSLRAGNFVETKKMVFMK